MSITWPSRSRLIPVAANSVTISFFNDAAMVASQTIVRPSVGSASAVTFPNLPSGTLTLKASAFPTADGTGTAQARASESVTLVSGTTTPLTITMASTIDRIALTPASPSITVGSTSTMVATPYDATGAIVLAPSTLVWSTSDSALLTVSQDGLATGIAVGTATITAVESESGKVASLTTSVAPRNAGYLRANAIYFGHWNDPSIVTSVLPDGTNRQDIGGGQANVVAAFLDPDHAGMVVYAAASGGLCGVYRGGSFDPNASECLAAPLYDAVTALQPMTNGAVMMVATKNGESALYVLESGRAERIDLADSAAASLDGTHIAYTKIVDGLDDLYVWDKGTGGSRLIVAEGNSLFPSFSKDGGWILFSSDKDGLAADEPWDLYQVPANGGAVQRMTNTPELSELGACFDSAHERMAYFGLGVDAEGTGVYVQSNSGAQRIAHDGDVAFAVYWTTANGRSPRAVGARYQSLRLPAGSRNGSSFTSLVQWRKRGLSREPNGP